MGHGRHIDAVPGRWLGQPPLGGGRPAGPRWFVTVDELENKRLSASEPLAAGFARLRAALTAAMDLRACGRTFVVAPVPTRDGEPLVRVNGRFGVAVYPFADGQSFDWGEFSSAAHRLSLLGLLVNVHTAPPAASRHALADDFAVPQRDELEAACAPDGDVADCGPYARRMSLLAQQYAAPLRRLLARYDALVLQTRAQGAPDGAYPRRASSGQHDADGRWLGADRLGYRARRPARAGPVGPGSRGRKHPGRLRRARPA